ncbi:MAG: Plasmid pRiA4b ORF-3-like protein, partial [Cyanobacteriota bacterium]
MTAPQEAPQGEWRKSLQRHVSLDDIEPPIWRRFLVEETITPGRLHEVLQIVM